MADRWIDEDRGIRHPACVRSKDQIDPYVADLKERLYHKPLAVKPVGEKTTALKESVDARLRAANQSIEEEIADARRALTRCFPKPQYHRADYDAAAAHVREAVRRRKTQGDSQRTMATSWWAMIKQKAPERIPIVGDIIDLLRWVQDRQDPLPFQAMEEMQAAHDAELADASTRDETAPAPPTRDHLGPPSPQRVYVDRVVRVDVPVPYVARQRAEGGFALRVVNERREAVAQAKAWSGRLRILDAERARRLADPAAAKGPGTPAWDELGQQIAHARAGLANAVTALWGQAAAQAAVAESEAQALPLSMAAWQRSRSIPAPAPVGPAADDAAPGSISTSGPGAVLPSPAPPPVAEADLSAVCEAFEEGLLAALREAR